MNFCATCGRQRNGDAQFCGGCGTGFPAAATVVVTPLADQPAGEFRQGAEATPGEPTGWDSPGPAAGEPPEWDRPAESSRSETAPTEWAAADATRIERQPDPTMIDPQGAARMPSAAAPAEPDPFASWFADPAAGEAPPRSDPPGQWGQPAGPWEPADTVYAAPAQRPAAYAPPQPPPYSPPPPPAYSPPQPPYGAPQAGPPGGRRSGGGRKAAFIIGVVLVMLAAGGGAYALVSRSNHNTAQPPAPTVTAKSSATASGNTSASASASPTTSPSTSASASPSASPGVVSLGAGLASNPAEPAVEKTLTDYFQGINTHDYAEYASSLDAQQLASQPESQFKSGYSSTSDSGMTLVSLTSAANGGLEATVTFTSHQAAGTGVDGSSCIDWTLDFYLVKQGVSYLKGAAPSGYQPTYSDC